MYTRKRRNSRCALDRSGHAARIPCHASDLRSTRVVHMGTCTCVSTARERSASSQCAGPVTVLKAAGNTSMLHPAHVRYMYVYVYMYMYIYTYAYMCRHAHMCMYTCTYIHVYVCVCDHCPTNSHAASVSSRPNACTRTCIHAYAHIHVLQIHNVYV